MVPHFKTHAIFAKDSETADSKMEEEEDHSHPELREQSHKAPVSQQLRFISPTAKVDHSSSQLLRDSDEEMLNEATSSSKAGSVHDDNDLTVADRAYEPVLVPLTMDIAMNKFPVRVGLHT